MDYYTLRPSVALQIGPKGPAIHIEAIGGDPAPPDLANNMPVYGLGPIYVGFGRIPTASDFDAIVPPLMQLDLPVLNQNDNIWLVYEPTLARGISALTPPVSPDPPTVVAVTFLPCVIETGLRPIEFVLPVPKQALGIPDDAWGSQWRPAAAMLYDQAQLFGGDYLPHRRPTIVPSIVDTLTVATAINTLFNFSGSWAFLTSQAPGTKVKFKVVHRIIVSVSAATLFVVGTNGLAVGAPDFRETGRLRFAAAGIQVIDYGEGLEVDALQQGTGIWRAYTSAAVTLDATIIGG